MAGALALVVVAVSALPNSSPGDDDVHAALDRMVDEEIIATGIKNPARHCLHAGHAEAGVCAP